MICLRSPTKGQVSLELCFGTFYTFAAGGKSGVLSCCAVEARPLSQYGADPGEEVVLTSLNL